MQRSTNAGWRAEELAHDRSWVLDLDDRARNDLAAALANLPAAESLLEHRRGDFDLGTAAPVIRAALDEVQAGRGIALIRGLPRDGLDEKAFERLTWAVGLHVGVARPQGASTQYISAVRDAGTNYRTGTGRGYSSNAELDFHTDSADIVFLSCYNKAESGGTSITTSTLAAYARMALEFPALVEWLHRPIHFSRQGEAAPDEGPTCEQPVYAEAEGNLICRWNWNRVNTAQLLPGVPPLPERHREALQRFDQIVRRPEFAHTMVLEPGDVQIVNSHRTLHSRTRFVDHPQPERKRLLYRLWLAPPDSPRLPESWRPLYRSVEPGTVRGGIRGRAYDLERRAFEVRQAGDLGMAGPAWPGVLTDRDTSREGR